MTDIEAKRDKVIEAARAWMKNGTNHVRCVRLCNAIAELDAALKPDPWQLLERIREHDIDPDKYSASDLNFEIDAALAWHKEHGNT